MKDVKKICAMSLASAMVLSSFAGCAMFDKSTKEVQTAAEDFADALISLKAKNIAGMYADLDEDDEEALKYILDMSNYSEEEASVIEAIAGTITYEIDSKSIEVDKKKEEASATITFTMVDYKAVLEEEYDDVDEILDAIEECEDTTEVELDVDFVNDDDEWLIDSSIDDLADFYEFLTVEVKGSVDVVALIDYLEWWGDVDKEYTNTDDIELDIWFTSDVYDAESFDITYKVFYEGEEVYESDPITVNQNGYKEAYYGEEQGAELEDDYYLPAGEYTITFYCEGEEIGSDTCTVTRTTTSTTAASTGSTTTSETFEIMDADFEANIIEAGWWDYDSTMISDGVYNTDTETIAFSIEVDSDVTDEIYYAYYFSADGSAPENQEDYVFQDTITPNTYNNGTFYDIDYKPATMEEGSYYLVIATDSSLETPLAIAYCEVVAE